MKKKKKNEVVIALHTAERAIQFERNGYDHPWKAVNIVHKNNKKYDRKRDRKNFNYDSDGISFCL